MRSRRGPGAWEPVSGARWARHVPRTWVGWPGGGRSSSMWALTCRKVPVPRHRKRARPSCAQHWEGRSVADPDHMSLQGDSRPEGRGNGQEVNMT